MKFFFLVLVILIPVNVFAACSTNGYTVVYVNGILTDKQNADSDKDLLKQDFFAETNLKNVTFLTGYNQSHLAGLGDLIKSVEQAYQNQDALTDDYDLNTILLQIHDEVKTQKILLVGHSQGTFYTNALYKYLVGHGVPGESIAVYNLATPASFVAGSGTYVTSSNDKLIESVREAVALGGALPPLPANITISLTSEEAAKPYGGHSFSGVYLAGAPNRIVSDISSTLSGLETTAVPNRDGGCFAPPPETLVYRAEKAVFSVADPAAAAATKGVAATGKSLAVVGNAAMALARAGYGAVASAVGLLPNPTAVLPPANRDTAKAAFGVAQALYGSSVSYEDVNGSDANFPKQNVASQPKPEPPKETESSSPPLAQKTEADVLKTEPPKKSASSNSSYGAGNSALPSVVQENTTQEATTSPDTAAPTLTLSSDQCGASLSSSGCLTATTTVVFRWNSADSDPAILYALSRNGLYATTTATSTTVIASNNETYQFGVSGFDAAGNQSATTTLSVSVAATPVVINEIAWGGTAASSTGQWIELYNITNQSVSLSSWTLTTNTLYIPLSGSIPARGYYLIEKDNDTVVSDVSADLISTFPNSGGGFGIGGDALTLGFRSAESTTTIDRVAVCSFWCGGTSNANGAKTMERYDANALGTDVTNWGTALGEFFLNGHDVNNSAIKGTPKAKNSIGYLVANGGTLSTNKTLTQANSPYLIDRSGLTVSSGTTLTLRPGTVIKIVSPGSPSFVVNGTLASEGTESEPVVITAFADDGYGGDMNGDGTCNSGNASSTASCPYPGSWIRLLFNSTSAGSTLTHTLVRYGGVLSSGTYPPAMVVASGASLAVNDSTFAYARKHGLHLSGGNSTVSNSLFEHNASSTDAVGLFVDGGNPTVSGNTFSNNSYGLEIASAPSAQTSGNTFTANGAGAALLGGDFGNFHDNSGTGNTPNAFVLAGGVTTSASIGTTTFASNSLPYLLRNELLVAASSTLALNSGVVIKGSNSGGGQIGKLTVQNGGSLFAGATAASDIIFTSVFDSSTSGTTTAGTPASGDWIGINVESGGTLRMSGFTVRYGGGAASGLTISDRGGIRLQGAATSTISNALVRDNKQNGIRITGGTSLAMSNTTISNHTTKIAGVAYGLDVVSPSSVTMNSVTFQNNEKDILGEGTVSVTCPNANCGTPTSDPSGLMQ